MIESHFTDSCAPVRYPCAVGSYYIDPCDCRKYFRCSTSFQVVQQTCARGTAFDHLRENCFFEQEIYAHSICLPHTPWQRCGQDVDLDALRRRCLNTTDDNKPSTRPDSSTGEATVNVGALVGGLLAGVIALGLVLAIVFFIRRGRPLSDYKFPRLWRPSTKSVSNPAYDTEASEPEEHYAEIKDFDSKNHRLEPPPTPRRPAHTLTPLSTPLPPRRQADGSRSRMSTPPPAFSPGEDFVYDRAYNAALPDPPAIALTPPPSAGYEEPRPLPEYYELYPTGVSSA